MKKLITTSLVAMMLITSSSAKADIRSSDKNDPDFIKITQTTESTVRFERCKVANESDCKQLGDRDYSASELKKLRRSLYFKAAGLAVADLVGVVVLAGIVTFGTTAIYEKIWGNFEGVAVLTGLFGGAFSVVGGLISAVVVDGISPFHQIGLARKMGPTLILDQDITVKKSILEYSKALNRLLRKIDE